MLFALPRKPKYCNNLPNKSSVTRSVTRRAHIGQRFLQIPRSCVQDVPHGCDTDTTSCISSFHITGSPSQRCKIDNEAYQQFWNPRVKTYFTLCMRGLHLKRLENPNQIPSCIKCIASWYPGRWSCSRFTVWRTFIMSGADVSILIATFLVGNGILTVWVLSPYVNERLDDSLPP